MIGPWIDADEAAFEAVLAAFADAHPGRAVRYEAVADSALLADAIRREVPDLAVLTSPALLRELVAEDLIVDIEFARVDSAGTRGSWRR